MRLFTGGSFRRGVLVAGIVLALAPRSSVAEIVDEEEVSHFLVNFAIGYQGTKMSDFNDDIRVVNYFLHSNQGIREANLFSGAAAVKGEIRYKFGDHVSIGMGVSSTEAKSAFDVTFGAVDFYTRATCWEPMIYYHMPFIQSIESIIADRMSLYVGAGPVFLSNGLGHMRITDRTTEPTFRQDGDLIEIDGQGEVTGTGAGFQGLVGASWQLTSLISFAGEVGYREAKITNPKIRRAEGFERDVASEDPERREPGDQAIIDFFERGGRPPGFPATDIEGNPIPYYNGGPIDLDFSGVQARLGVRFHLF